MLHVSISARPEINVLVRVQELCDSAIVQELCDSAIVQELCDSAIVQELCDSAIVQELCDSAIVQELCESRGGRPELSVLTSLLASVDVKIY